MTASASTLTVVATVLATVVLSGQTLADVARREEARRKAIRTPAKVYTNDDLAPFMPKATTVTTDLPPAPPVETTESAKADPALPTTGAVATTGAPADAPAAPSGPVTSPSDQAKARSSEAKGEAYWKGPMTEARAQLERETMLADAFQSRIKELSAEFSSSRDSSHWPTIVAERQKATTELQRLHRQIDDSVRRITQIQEEARTARVPPHWVE